MKKVIFVLALAALLVLPVAAKSQQVGVELGMVSGINYRTDIQDNLDLTASVGLYGFNSVDGAVGALYKMDPVKIGKASFYHQFGGQVEAGFRFSSDNNYFYVAPMGVAEIDYDFKWINDATFTAFFRVGYGPAICFGDGVNMDWGHFNGSIGLVHAL